VSVVHFAVTIVDTLPAPRAGSDAGEARWWSMNDLPALAFDHATILDHALRRLASELACASVARSSSYPLPGELTLQDASAACRAISAELRGV
jgi:8-oxo-dGTP diphosphatase